MSIPRFAPRPVLRPMRSAAFGLSCRASSRRAILATTAAALLGAWAALPAFAQDAFPTRPIRFIVPYAAGGTTDLVARTVGAHMSQTLGQTVVIENRGGAGGNLGMDAVAKAAPDGYTVGMGAISTNALNPHIYKKMSFDPRKDFSAIGLLGNSTIVLEVGPSLPVKTVAELRAHVAKNPGLPFGTAGAGTSMHLAGVLFGQAQPHRVGARALQGQRAADHRPDRRPDPRRLRQPARVAAAHPGRQAARAGGGRLAAQSGAAGCADTRGGRPAGLRDRTVVRRVRSRRIARAGRAPTGAGAEGRARRSRA